MTQEALRFKEPELGKLHLLRKVGGRLRGRKGDGGLHEQEKFESAETACGE